MHNSVSGRTVRLGLCAVGLMMAAVAPARAGDSLWGSFPLVKDGETVVVEGGGATYDVRLFGVVTPRTGQPLAAAGSDYLKAHLLGREGRFRLEGFNDRGEMVGRVFVDGTDLGLELVRAGLAWRAPEARYKPTEKGKPDPLTAAEDEARAAHRGVWGVAGLTPPAAPAGGDGGGPGEFVEAPEVAGNVDQNASKKGSDDNECQIAQNPANPLQLYMACNTSSAGLFAAKSADGGRTWTYPDAADKTVADGDPNQGPSACCDPTLSWDRYGNLFLTYINSSVNNIINLVSTDGGVTFTQLTSFSGSVDQPTVVTGDVGTTSVVWVVWNSSGNMVARGAAVTGVGAVGAFAAQESVGGAGGCSFGDVAVSPSGAVVQVCENPTGGQGPATLVVNRDADGLGAGGFNGSATSSISTNVGGFDFIPAQNSRSVDAEAGLAFDKVPSSPHFGRLYLVYTDETTNENNDLEVFVRTSDDTGSTWSSPVRVNDDATTRSQFMPKIASDPKTGAIGVCWHDARNSASNNTMQMFCTHYDPAPGAPVFEANSVVSDGASLSNGSGVEFGDYMGVAMVAGEVHPVWADTSNSTGDNPNGTSNFDAYSDYVTTPGLFSDGFESGDVLRWTSAGNVGGGGDRPAR
jgi:endonuclease YncB( thermonuclease family)